MAYKVASDAKQREIALSEYFITEYMPEANGNFVKVYLLGLGQCNSDNPLSQREMADKLSMLESDIIRAWKYWEEKNVVRISGDNIEFLDLSAKKQQPAFGVKPSYFPDEIAECVSRNPELDGMFKIVAGILGKILSSADMSVIYSMYDFYRLPTDVIPMLVSHCVRNGKKSMRQIENTAVTWTEKGIDSVEEAEKYLKKVEEYTKAVNKLKKGMGVTDRLFSPTETKYINSWLYDFKYPYELIMKAYDICATNTGKLQIKYMDKVLLDLTAAPKPTEEKKDSKSNAKPTKFSNFDQRDFDYEAFESKPSKRGVK